MTIMGRQLSLGVRRIGTLYSASYVFIKSWVCRFRNRWLPELGFLVATSLV